MRGKMRLKRHAPEGDDAAAGVDCMVCGVQLDGLDASARSAHVNACIDGRAVAAEASFACAVCGRDLSEYTQSARLHHANRCCDNLGEATADSPKSSAGSDPPVAASSAGTSSEGTSVAEPSSCRCVVCGKDITNLKKQTDHMKRCAKRTGMSAARLLELIRGGDAGPGGVFAGETVRQSSEVAPRRVRRDQPQWPLGSGKENMVAPTATTAAHMPTDSAIVTWLRKAGLAKYCPIFVREEIDLDGVCHRPSRMLPLGSKMSLTILHLYRLCSGLRLLDDADLQRIGISSLGPRRKILGLLAQQHKSGASADDSLQLRTNRSTDSPVRLTPPMLESQLAKRHCVKASTSCGHVDVDAVAAATAAKTQSGEELGCEEQSSLWELASRHDAKPFEYRTVLLPDQQEATTVGCAAVAASAAGQASQPSVVDASDLVHTPGDETRLAALDDLLQESSPPARTADIQRKGAATASVAACLCDDEVSEPATATATSAGSGDATERRLSTAGTSRSSANVPDSNFSVRNLSSARPDSQTMATWNMADARLATVLELPVELRSALNEPGSQRRAATASSSAASVDLIHESRYRTRMNALREKFLEQLRRLRLEYGRQVEDLLKTREEMVQRHTKDVTCGNTPDEIDVYDTYDSATVSPDFATQMDTRVPTIFESDVESLADTAIMVDDDESAMSKDTRTAAHCDNSNKRDGDTPCATLSGEIDRDAPSLFDSSHQAVDEAPPTRNLDRQEATGQTDTKQLPNFSDMDLAELKKRVKQFGLKVNGKKVMVRQLTEIWIAQNRAPNDSKGTNCSLTKATSIPASSAIEATSVGSGAPWVAQDQSSSAEPRPNSKLSREQILSRQVRAFVLSQPQWYTQVLVLNAIDMRALHAALNSAASLDSDMLRCSLKQLEIILREQGISFQAQS